MEKIMFWPDHIVDVLKDRIVEEHLRPRERLVVYSMCGPWTTIKYVLEDIVSRKIGGALLLAVRNTRGLEVVVSKEGQVHFRGYATDWCRPTCILKIINTDDLRKIVVEPDTSEVYLLVAEDRGYRVV